MMRSLDDIPQEEWAFEWDEAKAAFNRSKHHVAFEEAAEAMGDPFCEQCMQAMEAEVQRLISGSGREVNQGYLMGPDGAPQKNKYGQPVHQYVYAHVYHELLNGMIERQMRKAILFTASCWYTAWVNAGRPDMSDWDSEALTEANAANYTADMKAYKNGKVRGCHTQKEFPSVAPAAQ